VGTNELIGGLLHEGKVDWMGVVPRVFSIEGLLNGAEAEIVCVDFRLCGESGVEGGIDKGGEEDANITGEVSVEGMEDTSGIDCFGGGEMDDLPFCMDAPVGAAGSFALDGVL